MLSTVGRERRDKLALLLLLCDAVACLCGFGHITVKTCLVLTKEYTLKIIYSQLLTYNFRNYNALLTKLY